MTGVVVVVVISLGCIVHNYPVACPKFLHATVPILYTTHFIWDSMCTCNTHIHICLHLPTHSSYLIYILYIFGGFWYGL
ncbi:hypothetical protein MOQ_002244, partial [Trypanosoma cruzi marinkellei]